MDFLIGQNKLPLWAFIPGLFLLLIYGMLSYLAFADPTFWYESMGIPTPEHGFLLLSWGGKNNAMFISLLLGLLSRQRLPVAIALAVLLTGQLGDSFAGAQTGVNVFVTYIGMGFVALQLVFMYLSHGRQAAKLQPAIRN
ncbi:MAG: hypothetical protein AAF614_00750 [Chloroflexota bacterium]